MLPLFSLSSPCWWDFAGGKLNGRGLITHCLFDFFAELDFICIGGMGDEGNMIPWSDSRGISFWNFWVIKSFLGHL